MRYTINTPEGKVPFDGRGLGLMLAGGVALGVLSLLCLLAATLVAFAAGDWLLALIVWLPLSVGLSGERPAQRSERRRRHRTWSRVMLAVRPAAGLIAGNAAYVVLVLASPALGQLAGALGRRTHARAAARAQAVRPPARS